MKNIHHTLLTLISVAALGGCTSNVNKVVGTDTSTADIAHAEYGGSAINAREKLHRMPEQHVSIYSEYTRSASNEIRTAFKRLPNPTLQMYVYPHITEGGIGVMGYSVEFDMYETDQYAMPGEVEGWNAQ